MKITEIKLYRVKSGNTGEKGARFGESQYWGGGWQTGSHIANPMSIYPKYAQVRTLWMGPGQDPYGIEILTDEGVTGKRGQLWRRLLRVRGDRAALPQVFDWPRSVQH